MKAMCLDSSKPGKESTVVARATTGDIQVRILTRFPL